MPQTFKSRFSITGWDPSSRNEDWEGPTLGRAIVKKEFTGDLEGTSVAELLTCQADPTTVSAGAGFVASELVSGVLNGHQGTFVMQHTGTTGGGAPPKTLGSIVPGSGTGALSEIGGTIEITVDEAGVHFLTLQVTGL